MTRMSALVRKPFCSRRERTSRTRRKAGSAAGQPRAAAQIEEAEQLHVGKAAAGFLRARLWVASLQGGRVRQAHAGAIPTRSRPSPPAPMSPPATCAQSLQSQRTESRARAVQ